MRTSKSGTAIGATLLIAVVITVVLAGLLKWVHTESRISRQSVLTNKARYAAEATCEFGMAQMRSTLQRQPVIASDYFVRNGSGDEPILPPVNLLGMTASTGLSSVGAIVNQTGTTYGLVDDVIGTLETLFDSNGGDETGTANSGRHTVQAVALHVGPFSAMRRQYMDPANPLYKHDPLSGEEIPLREARVLAAARAADSTRAESATAYAETIFQLRNVPLFRFISFYNLDIELSAAGGMEIHGPVHTNRNLYVQGGSEGTNTNFHGVVTVAGGIYHGRAPDVNLSVNKGAVAFSNWNNSLVQMKETSTGSDGKDVVTWVDSDHPDWADKALQKWGGRVRTREHGVQPEMMTPIPTDSPDTPLDELPNSAHVTIKPPTPNPTDAKLEVVKMSSKASLIFELTSTSTTTTETRTRWVKQNGKWVEQTYTVDVTVPGLAAKAYKMVQDDAGPYVRKVDDQYRKYKRVEVQVPANLFTYREFYDNRWAKTVQSADLDVGRLKDLVEQNSNEALWTKAGNGFDADAEWNGVVYVEHKDTHDAAVRLVNGGSIPNLPTAANNNQKGFTVATNAPVYIKGNYNADGSLPADAADVEDPDSNSEPPAAIWGDAVTVLSNAWDDADSTEGISSRRASQTEIAAAIVGGIVPSMDGEYSGGWHNMVRMLEDWRSVKLAYRSSMAALFTSEIANEPWAGQSPVYEPPLRWFSLNRLFREGIMPPGTDPAPSYRAISSRSLTEAEYQTALTEIGAN